jgi:hypothetical protein
VTFRQWRLLGGVGRATGNRASPSAPHMRARWILRQRMRFPVTPSVFTWIADTGVSRSRDKYLRTVVGQCESATGVAGVLNIASALTEFATTVRDLDRDPHLLNVANGTLDLGTGQLHQRERHHLQGAASGARRLCRHRRPRPVHGARPRPLHRRRTSVGCAWARCPNPTGTGGSPRQP